MMFASLIFFFFFNDTATTEIYTLSLHDALPISARVALVSTTVSVRSNRFSLRMGARSRGTAARETFGDRKSTRLNSSHSQISYAVFCLKKKNNNEVAIITKRV